MRRDAEPLGLLFLARLAPWLSLALLFALGFSFGVPAMLAGAALAGQAPPVPQRRRQLLQFLQALRRPWLQHLAGMARFTGSIGSWPEWSRLCAKKAAAMDSRILKGQEPNDGTIRLGDGYMLGFDFGGGPFHVSAVTIVRLGQDGRFDVVGADAWKSAESWAEDWARLRLFALRFGDFRAAFRNIDRSLERAHVETGHE